MFEVNALTKLKAPLSVNLEITDKCNLSCSFCFNAAPEYVQLMKAGEQPFIEESGFSKMQQDRKDRLFKIVDKLAAAEVFEVRLFGGEFTVFKYWRDVVSHIASKDLFISFVSNGYLFTDQDVELLTAAGLKECNISIHGPEEVHDQITRKAGSFRRAMQSVEMFRKQNVTVSITYTPIVENLGHVYGFVELLQREYSVEHFGINRLFRDERYRNLTLKDYHALLETIDRCHRDFGTNIYLLDSFPRCMVPIKHWEYLSYCSQAVGFAQVDFNGNIKHCSAISIPIGNVLDQDVSLLWDQELKGVRSLEHLPRSCQICPIFCGGGCTASRGVNNKFAPDEFIPWPQEETLLQAVKKALYNRGRRIIFDVFYRKSSEKDRRPVASHPALSQKYRVRKEDDETFIAMFERKGIKILTPLAAHMLQFMDGSNSIDQIFSACQSAGLSCTTQEIIKIAQELT